MSKGGGEVGGVLMEEVVRGGEKGAATGVRAPMKTRYERCGTRRGEGERLGGGRTARGVRIGLPTPGLRREAESDRSERAE